MADEAGMDGVIVTAVSEEQLHDHTGLTRYVLALSGYREPITLIGKQTNIIEAQFYRHVAAEVRFLVPYCWFSHISGNRAWIVIDEVYDDWPAPKWTRNDVEGVVDNLARLHAGSWEQTALLERLGWRPLIALAGTGESVTEENKEAESHTARWAGFQQEHSFLQFWDRDYLASLSDHAIHNAGRLAPALASAAEGLEAIKSEGGWPGVVEGQHIQAMVDLLDDPVPMLHPLRQLPETLIHGNPSTEHWHLDMFGQYRLLDWHSVTIGPGIYDLVSFIEQYEMINNKKGSLMQRNGWPVSIETIEDSYLLAMGSKLGSHYNALANRRAIPAARCLYVITTWLPRFAKWLLGNPDELVDWPQSGRRRDDGPVADLLLTSRLRHHLCGVFDRFLKAYRAL